MGLPRGPGARRLGEGAVARLKRPVDVGELGTLVQ